MEVNIKRCKQCGEVKEKETDFYRAGNSFQSMCKPCHNANRAKYPYKNYYIKRPNKYSNPEFIKKVEDLRKEYKKWAQISKELNIKYASLIQFKTLNNIK